MNEELRFETRFCFYFTRRNRNTFQKSYEGLSTFSNSANYCVVKRENTPFHRYAKASSSKAIKHQKRKATLLQSLNEHAWAYEKKRLSRKLSNSIRERRSNHSTNTANTIGERRSNLSTNTSTSSPRHLITGHTAHTSPKRRNAETSLSVLSSASEASLALTGGDEHTDIDNNIQMHSVEKYCY